MLAYFINECHDLLSIVEFPIGSNVWDCFPNDILDSWYSVGFGKGINLETRLGIYLFFKHLKRHFPLLC